MGRTGLALVVAGMAAAVLLVGARSQGTTTPGAPTSRPSPQYPLLEAAPDVRRERLCREALAPDAAPDPIRIDCAIETGTIDRPPASGARSLTVVAFNVERGFEADRQVRAFRENPPDVLLLSEVDRGCSRTGYRNVARDYAESLGMSYAYGVEFLELPRPSGPGRRIESVCEHGNAILSRFPIESPRVLRFAANRSWYAPPAERLRGGEPRLGGRMALAAAIRVGDRRVEVYSFHLESGLLDGRYRDAQAFELVEDAARRPLPRVLGGDSNFHAYAVDLLLPTRLEPAVGRFERSGLRDAHRGLFPLWRSTHVGRVVIDLILSDAPVEAAGVGRRTTWAGLSDHLPVWARLRIEPP